MSGCSIAQECSNDGCVFRQQQVYGLTCWAAAYKEFYGDGPYPEGVEDLTKLRDEVIGEYGSRLPEVEVTYFGTNRPGIKCNDFMPV